MHVRADRLATLYLFHPLRRLMRRQPTGIPILMYHSISRGPEVRKNAYFHTRTDPAIFREHIHLLARSGYKTIGLGEVVRRLKETSTPHQKLVVITFDDGFEDFYTAAFPVVHQFGYTATIFLATAYIGVTARQFNGNTCLTWKQVRELHKYGIEFGAHTVTHPRLTTLSTVDVNREVRSSKETIEDHLGTRVASFSYPYAFPEACISFRRKLRELLQLAGYENGVSTVVGTANPKSDSLFLERLPVNWSDDDQLLRAKLDGAYDWLRAPQRIYKALKKTDS